MEEKKSQPEEEQKATSVQSIKQPVGFMEYPNIEIINEKIIAEYLKQLPEKFDFNQHKVYITEKIHGTNFSVVCDTKNNQLLLCKRSKPITSWFSTEINLLKDLQSHMLESFFPTSVKHVVEKRFKQFVQLFSNIKKDYPDAQQIHIFGELFGGQYSPQEKGKGQFNLIQREIKYSNEPDFYLFDIFIDRFRMDCDKFYEQCKAVDYPIAPLLKVATIHDIMDIKEQKIVWVYKDFQTTIPKLIGLEELNDNIAEGVVIKYHDQVWKSKSQKFLEVAQQPKAQEKKETKSVEANSFAQFTNRITFNRLENVMIKEGYNATADQAWAKIVEDIKDELKRSGIIIDSFDEQFMKQEDQLKKKFKGIYTGLMSKYNKK